MPDYESIRSGQDLIDAGVIPKTSSAHLALITYRRLENLRDKVLSAIDEETLGRWIPAFQPQVQEVSETITGSQQVAQHARVGLRVRQIGSAGLEGTIKSLSAQFGIGVEWDRPIPLGDDLGGLAKKGHGGYLPPQNLILLVPDGKLVTGYQLAPGAVADEKLGHLVRFATEYAFRVDTKTPSTYYGNVPHDGQKKEEAVIPAGTKARLGAYDAEQGRVQVLFEKGFPGKPEIPQVGLHIPHIAGLLEVSTLGQVEPRNLEEEVCRQVLQEFFPVTRIETQRAYWILAGLMMQKDMIFYGPAGAGKTQIAEDIVRIGQLQKNIFIVEGCQAQCSPFSLFDEEFSKVVSPCPECMIKYDLDFKRTGKFHRPQPKDVEVTVAEYRGGLGIEFADGTSGLDRMHLVGYKLPKMDDELTRLLALALSKLGGMGAEEKKDGSGKEGQARKAPQVKVQAVHEGVHRGNGRESDFDPTGFHAGLLIRSNNGIALIDETDKLRPVAQYNLLQATNSGRVKPDQLRFRYPANNMVLGTANDPAAFSDALNDRMLLFAIRYPEEPDTSYEITRSSYHGESMALEDVPLPDTHRERPISLRDDVVMPVTIERAVDALYVKFRREYQGPGKTGISASNRSKFDALDAARAMLLLDQVFYKGTPKVASEHYALRGVQFALRSRVKETNEEASRRGKEDCNKWVQENFPKSLREEEDTWWCRVKKDIALAKAFMPDIEQNFYSELAGYDASLSAARETFRKVRQAYAEPQNQAAQFSRRQYPFMDYLFRKHPAAFRSMKPEALQECLQYFLSSRYHSKCWNREELPGKGNGQAAQ